MGRAAPTYRRGLDGRVLRRSALQRPRQDRFRPKPVSPMSVWVMCGRRRLGKNFLSCCSIGRVRSCVRPVLCGGEAAGHNALRGSGPNQKHAFKDALTQTGSPDPGSTLSALRRHVLANSFKLQTPSSFPGLTSLNRSGFDANQSIALRCRRVGAVHSIKSEKAQNEQMLSAPPPKADIDRHDWHVRFVPIAT